MSDNVNKKLLKASGITALVLVVCLIAIGIFEAFVAGMKNSVDFAHAGERWSADGSPYAVLATYTEKENAFSVDSVEQWQHQIMTSLISEAVSDDTQVWTWAASFETEVHITGSKGSASAAAVVSAGDFFVFHRLHYLYGSGFLNDNSIPMGAVIDENLAWKLFGAVNIVGKTFMIGDEEYTVTGVVKPDSDKGVYGYTYGETPRLYLSYAGYRKVGNGGFTTYEAALPNPVKGFAKNIYDGAVMTGEPSEEIEITSRYTIMNRLENMKKLKYSWISLHPLAYPYWENEARIYDYRCAVMMVFEIILAAIAVVCVLLSIIFLFTSGYSPIRSVKNLTQKYLKKIKNISNEVTEMKKTLSFLLAILMILSCVSILSSCKKEGGTDLSKLPKSKRTAVYKEQPFDGISLKGYVNDTCVAGDRLIVNYDMEFTIVRDENYQEVERFEGYHYQYGGGVYENDFVVYNTGVYSENFDVVEIPEEELNAADAITEEPMPIDLDAAADMLIDVDSREGAPSKTEEGKLEGEEDQYGVILGENGDIQVPDGWYVDYEAKNILKSISLTDGTSVDLTCDYQKVVGEQYPEYADQYGYSSRMLVNSDGDVVALYMIYVYNQETYESDNQTFLITIDSATGDVKQIARLNDCFASAGLQSSDVYINYIAAGDDGIIYFNAGDMDVIGVDKDMKITTKLSIPNAYIGALSAFGDKVLVSAWDQNWNSQSFYLIENGQLVPQSDSVKNSLQDFYNNLGGAGSRVFFRSGTGISYYDFETDTVSEELNFINSDIDTSEMGDIIYAGENKFILVNMKWDISNNLTTFSLMTKVPEEEIKEEVIVKIGSIYSDYTLAKNIIAFNKQDTGVRVTLQTYEQYNNEENEWSGGLTQLQNEIVTGALPDIVLLDSGMPIESYFHKGVFVDLNKYIDGDNGIDREVLLDNVFRANETNGKLYSAIVTFVCRSLAAKSKYVGNEQGWTFEEMIEAIKKMPDGMTAFYGYGRDQILNSMLRYGMDSFVNWDTGETKFDSQAFIDFITYLKTLPEKSAWEEYYSSMESAGEFIYDPDKERELTEKDALQFWKDYGLFASQDFYSFSDIRYMYNRFASRDVTLIGFPTNNGGNGAVLSPITEVAISAKSGVKDQAWEFVKFMLTSEKSNENYYFSTNRAFLQKMLEKTAEEQERYYDGYYNDYEWMRESGYSEDYINFQINSNGQYEDSMGQTVYDYIVNASVIARTDEELVDIVIEELSGFFAGTKSAEDTARVIASRARIVISEKS